MSDDTESSELSQGTSTDRTFYDSENTTQSDTTMDDTLPEEVEVIDDASSEEPTASEYESTQSEPLIQSAAVGNSGSANNNGGVVGNEQIQPNSQQQRGNQGHQMINEPMEGVVVEIPLVNVEQQSIVIVRGSQSVGRQNDENNSTQWDNSQDDKIKPPNNKKKRQRKSRIISDDEFENDDDDGLTCPICLDHWEMTGVHRLVSLKCGHLFGESCIRRWLRECSAGSKCCPQCKTKALPRDIRYLYARKMVVVDNTETMRLQKELDEERQKVTSLQMELQMARMEHKIQQNLIVTLQQQIAAAQFAAATTSAKLNSTRTGMYKLFMEKNIEITQQPGCRVLAYAKNKSILLASQKSTASIFPGYGVRFIDLPTFRPTNYLHMSPNIVRDINFDHEDQDVLVAATGERSCKLYSVSNRSCIETMTPSETSQVWACAFDRCRTKFLYLGTQNGSIFVYDTRQPRSYLKEHKTPGDFSPVLNVWSVPASDITPFGGFLVCKLVSCWFFEYTSDHNVIPTRLNIDGPFLSMHYDPQTTHALINTRPSTAHPTTRHILADITKINDTTASLTIVQEFHGSKVQSLISRSSQINLRNNVVVAAYCEDSKILQTWSKAHASKMHSLPVNEKILDTCPIYFGNDTHLAALTDTKCRVYKFVEDTS